jgi:LPS export ABC transporter protein LptC
MNKLFYFLTLIFLIFLFSCSGDENTTRKVDFNPDVMPDQNGIDIKVVFTDSTQKKAVLYAGLAEIYNKRKETLLDSNVRVEFYKNNIHVSTLTSKKAKIDDRTKNMLASDSVVVISLESARKLETEILEWNELEQRIYSTEFVKITTENEIIKGYGFESDPNLTDYKLHKVSGIQNISGVDNE